MGAPRFRRGLDVFAFLKLAGTKLTATFAELNELVAGAATALHKHVLANGASDVTATAAQLNEAGIFFADTNITGAEAEELTDGSTTDLHEHELAQGANDVTATADQVNSLVQFPGLHAIGVCVSRAMWPMARRLSLVTIRTSLTQVMVSPRATSS